MPRADTQSLGEVATGFVARLIGRSPAELPPASGEEWLGVLRQWLARVNCGLVSIADPGKFSWPGHWIGFVRDGGPSVAVLLFGTPSAVIESPSAPGLVGRGVEELAFEQGLLLVPIDPFTQPAVQRDRRIGEVTGIFITNRKTEPMRPVEVVTAIAGKGLDGDRYAAGAGTFTPTSTRLRGYDITLIESEVLERMTPLLAPGESRRNLVTKGIDLNALVGKEFQIGSVRALGQRLCEPCVHLQRLTRPGVVADLVHRGGLRADLLSGGEIRVGSKIQPVQATDSA